MSRAPRPALRGSSYDEYICIRNFMSAEGGMGLSGVKAQVYALIYSHSPADTLANDTGCYYGSIAYTAARIGAGRSTTIDALKWLLKNGLLVEQGEHVQGDSSTTKKYVVDRERAIAAQQRFKDYWDLRESQYRQTEPSRPETVPERPYGENGGSSRPETVPGDVGARPKTVPENQPDSLLSCPRPETVPESGSPRPVFEPDHVQKPYPIVQVDSPSRSLEQSTYNSSIPPTSRKPSVGGMDGGSVDKEIKADLEPELLAALKALMLRSINQRAPLAEILPAYRDALAAGYAPEQIDRGYTAYIKRYRRKNPDTADYAMRLSNYLVRGDGLRYDEPNPENSPEAASLARLKRRRKAMLHDETLRELCMAIPTDDDVKNGTATREEQAAAQMRFDDYFDYTEGKTGTEYERKVKSFLGHAASETKHPAGGPL